MVLHTITVGEHVFASHPRDGEQLLTPDTTLEFTRDAVAHVHGNATRLWAFGRAKVHVFGEFDEVFVLGDSEVHLHGKCRFVDVGMNGTLHITDERARGTLVYADQHGTVHATDGIKIRGYGESRIHAPSTADVVLSWYAQWHTESEVRGNLSTYRPGYIVVR